VSRLTATERIALAPLALWTDLAQVRVHRGHDAALTNLARRAVLSLSRGRACALGNHVFLPDRLLHDIPVLAHEAAHCGQYQRWGALRYFTRGAGEQARYTRWRRTGAGANPYAYRVEPRRPFGTYGMEQQGQLVEDAFRGSQEAREVLGWRGY
jgi:hypothetical protein